MGGPHLGDAGALLCLASAFLHPHVLDNVARRAPRARPVETRRRRTTSHGGARGRGARRLEARVRRRNPQDADARGPGLIPSSPRRPWYLLHSAGMARAKGALGVRFSASRRAAHSRSTPLGVRDSARQATPPPYPCGGPSASATCTAGSRSRRDTAQGCGRWAASTPDARAGRRDWPRAGWRGVAHGVEYDGHYLT